MEAQSDVSLAEACEEIAQAAAAAEASVPDGQGEDRSNGQIPSGKTFPRTSCSVVRRVVRMPGNKAGVGNKLRKRFLKGSLNTGPSCGVSKTHRPGLRACENPHASKETKQSQSTMFPADVASKAKSLPPSYPFKVPHHGQPVAYVRFVITRFSGKQTVFPAEREVELMKRILVMFTYDELKHEFRDEFKGTIKKILPFYHGEYNVSEGYQRRIARTLEFLEYLTKNREAEFVVVPAVPNVHVLLLTLPETN